MKDSPSDFPKAAEAPKGAPNILLILTDDVGFGASSPFGGADAVQVQGKAGQVHDRPEVGPQETLVARVHTCRER